jgi:two-component system phosphate regulon sensor histidine kinase PhoR
MNLTRLASGILAIVLLLSLTGVRLLDRIYRETVESSLIAAAQAAAALIPAELFREGSAPAAVSSAESPAGIAAEAIAGNSGYRCTLIRPDGSVAAEASGILARGSEKKDASQPASQPAAQFAAQDAAPAPSSMENHALRPEVARALEGEAASSWRFSSTLGAEFLYAAVPVRNGSRIAGVLRLAILVPRLESRLAPMYRLLALSALAAAAIAIAAAYAATKRMLRPLERLARQATLMASGQSVRAELFRPRDRREASEIVTLTEALDRMAAELSARIEDARKRSGEFAAILESMKDAIFALDPELTIRMANSAAAGLTIPSGDPPAGRELLAALRSGELYALAAECRDSGEDKSGDFALYASGERWYHACAAALPRAASARPGVVLILSEFTEMRRLENVRRDFVANVSHELRTPIQLIAGFSETLLAENLLASEQDRHFLEIIRRNAERMGDIVHDLLSLARLEQDPGGWLALDTVRLSETMKAAVEAVEAVHLDATGTKPLIRQDAPEGLAALANAGLVEQALINLLDNAVKYSPEGSPVRLGAKEEAGMVTFSVEDSGPGIPPRDLAHIFERFYRVDKARSRTSGGTGLGLAIVRHIALIHGGSVSATSAVGRGSTFLFSIPTAGPPGLAGKPAPLPEDSDQPRMP